MAFTRNKLREETDAETDSGFFMAWNQPGSLQVVSSLHRNPGSASGDLRPRLRSSTGAALKMISIRFSTTSEADSHIKVKEYLTSDWYFTVY